MTLNATFNIMWGMATGETFPATLLSVGCIYHDPDDGDTYFRVVAIQRDGGIVSVFREDGTEVSYHVASPVVIVHSPGDPTVPPAPNSEFAGL